MLLQAVANDVTELRRIADIMSANEHYAKDSVKERLKKVNLKYSKFKSALEKRKAIVSASVAMYKETSEVRKWLLCLYDKSCYIITVTSCLCVYVHVHVHECM